METYECEEDERSMCFQADEFINMALNSDNLRERVSSKRVNLHDGPRLKGQRRLILHESRIEELDYEGASDTLDSQCTE